MQNAADIAASWSDENKQRMNASKSQYMTFSLQLNNSISNPVTINGDPVNQTSTAKLLGVQLDSHLTFSEHVNSAICKTRSAVHGLLTLKRHGVKENSLIKFYQARILSILSYAAPGWYTYTSQLSKDALERHQSLCLRIIYPCINSYTERLAKANITRINELLSAKCIHYATKVANTPSHRLNHLIPPQQSQVAKHSKRLTDRRVLRPRTSLYSKSLFSVLT